MKYLQDKSSQEINTFVCCGICAKLVGARLPAPGKIFGHTDFLKCRWEKSGQIGIQKLFDNLLQ
jgi:hypothetical protein